jgi:hypothetical protein
MNNSPQEMSSKPAVSLILDEDYQENQTSSILI